MEAWMPAHHLWTISAAAVDDVADHRRAIDG
jgi:hypothetical protein